MDCREFDLIVESYALAELEEAQTRLCEEHLQVCESCRESLEVCHLLTMAVHDEPELVPTSAESAALMQVLKQVELCPKPVRREIPVVPGFAGFVLASVMAFVVVAAALALQIFGLVDFGAVFDSVGYSRMAVAVTLVVFVTTFVPIAMTAWRRPLNGMTFRR